MSVTDGQREQAENRRHERQLEQQAHSANLMDELEQQHTEFIRELMKSDLDNGTIRVLDNYLSPDFILSKMEGADLTRFMWHLEISVLQLMAMHPPQGGVGGKARAYYYDDPNDALEPLRPDHRARIREFKDGILARVKRSHGGFQQNKFSETTSRVETVSRDEEEDGKGRIRGFLGR